MAVRNILTDEDPLLRKTSREVSEITPRIETLVEDMLDTLYETGNGIGLAAPQVGVLRRVFVIDLQEDEHSRPLVFINPEIYETDGSQVNQEGCLSVPGRWGEVERPAHLRVRALNAKGEPFDMEATGLLATCICHENDHLDGILFTDKVIGELDEA